MHYYNVEVWNTEGKFAGPSTVVAENPRRAALNLMRIYGRTALSAGGSALVVHVVPENGHKEYQYAWNAHAGRHGPRGGLSVRAGVRA